MIDRIIDVGIITFIPTEIGSLFKILNISEENFVNINSKFNYWKTELYSDVMKKSISVVVSHINGESGNTEAAVCTAHFMRDWYPRLMCLVGIGAGIKGKIKIGDVVVPKTIHDRSIKVFKENKYSTRGISFSRSDSLERILKKNQSNLHFFNALCSKLLKSDVKLAKKICLSIGYSNKEFSPPFSIADGSISSDNVLIRDPKYFEGIINETDEKCRGGEMEAAGFVRSCQIENIGFPWLVFRGISDFGDKQKNDEFQSLAAKSASICLLVYLQKVINVEALPLNTRGMDEMTSLEYNLIDQIEEAYKNKSWIQVCNIGKIMSRHLWISGQYELRFRIGKMVEEASGIINELSIRANTLIDDLGWTSFILKRPDAKKYIHDGIRIANEIPESGYFIAKGYRHLASISRREKNFKLASEYLDKANQAIAKISNLQESDELKNSLVLSQGKLFFSQRNYEESIRFFTKALKLFRDKKDGIRETKVYSLIGESFLEVKKIPNAISFFRKGRIMAAKFGRYDEFAKNSELLISTLDSNNSTKKYELARSVYNFAIAKGLMSESSHWKKIMLKYKKVKKIK